MRQDYQTTHFIPEYLDLSYNTQIRICSRPTLINTRMSQGQ